MNMYRVRRADAADIISRLAYALQFNSEDRVDIDLAEIGDGTINMFVDGYLTATLRPEVKA